MAVHQHKKQEDTDKSARTPPNQTLGPARDPSPKWLEIPDPSPKGKHDENEYNPSAS